MKILVITNLYPPQNLGGFGICIFRLAEGLRRSGYKIKVLCGNQANLGTPEKLPEIERCLELLGEYKNGVSNLKDLEEKVRRRRKNLENIENTIKQYRPDGCLIGNLDLLGKEILDKVLLEGIPTVQHIGFMGSPFEGNWIKNKKNYKLAFASGEVKRLFRKIGHKVEDYPVIYPPIIGETEKYSLNRNINGPIRIGYSGLIMPSKGVHKLLEAIARLKKDQIEFRLDLAGEIFSKQYFNQCKYFIKENNIEEEVNWLGFINPEEMGKFYREIELLVFPSIYPEAFGMVVAEAMSYGVLPISSGVGGAFEVVVHGTDGLIYEPENSIDLYRKLKWCSKNRDNVKRMGRKARLNSLKRFSIKESGKQISNIFGEMIQSKSLDKRANEKP